MRRSLVLVAAIIFLDALLFGALIPLLPGYVDDFDLSKLQAGLLFGAFAAGALLFSIPAGILAGRLGPRLAVILGLVALAGASFAFALAEGPVELGLARFVQGISSTTTWAGALAWAAVITPRERRGATLGTVFGFAVLGFVVGPLFGGIAHGIGVRGSFLAVGVVSLLLATGAWLQQSPAGTAQRAGAVGRAAGDRGFMGGLWLSALPAFYFGAVEVLAPLELDGDGYSAFRIGLVFFTAGLIQASVNRPVGKLSDARGYLYPVRIGLVGSSVVAVLLAVADEALAIAVLVVLAALTIGALYAPGMALVSDRAEVAGLTQGFGFGLMNAAWSLGAVGGPTVGGALADGVGEAAPYLLCGSLCVATLAAATSRAGRWARSAA